MDEHDTHGGRSFLSGLLIGALVGAGLALLFAPQSGEETRRIIRRKARKLADEARERYEDANDRVREAGRRRGEEATAE
jgi:gas vesicle protein